MIESPYAVTWTTPQYPLAVHANCITNGVDQRFQSAGLGGRLLAQALSDCHASGRIMPFVSVIPDCLGHQAKSFYQRYNFEELSGHPMKLMSPWSLLDAMMRGR